MLLFPDLQNNPRFYLEKKKILLGWMKLAFTSVGFILDAHGSSERQLLHLQGKPCLSLSFKEPSRLLTSGR